MHSSAHALPATVSSNLVSLFAAGDWRQLELAAAKATARYPMHPLGWRALGKARLQLGKPAEALAVLSRVVRLVPNDADGHNDIGFAYAAGARRDEAETSYRRALALDPRCAAAHTNLGSLLSEAGRFEEAIACHRAALAVEPDSAMAHNNLGSALREAGDAVAAEASYRRALTLRPDYVQAWINLGTVLTDLTRWEDAKAAYRQALRLDAGSALALGALGRLLGRLHQDDEAAPCLERAIALGTADSGVCNDLGNILMRRGQTDAALALFRRAQAMQPLITWRANQPRPAFSALFLDTPLAGSTPLAYLVGRAPYDRHFHCVMPGGIADIAMLRARADVVFNMIANADDGAAILAQALELVDQLDRPVVNHPRAVMATDRAAIARRLAGLDGCAVPPTIRLRGAALAEAAARGGCTGFALPVLVRLAGTHGGDDFDRFDDWADVAAHGASAPAAEFYLSNFVDYRSADGYYRKYRVICIDGAVLPYHLAIHDDWKVHHFRTDMANQAWMRAEEAQFLDAMDTVFDARQCAALRAIGAATGLDYCGIDCALDAGGCIVVFEANASMLVHDEKDATFTYKNAAVARIKAAFDTMLARRRVPA